MRIKEISYDFETNKKNKNIKLVHLSDIHYCDNYNIKILNNMLEAIKTYMPNYVCITGDLMDTYGAGNKESNSDVFGKWLEDIGGICPVMVIIGNHDIDDRKYNWKELDNIFMNKLRNIANVHFLINESYYDGDICFMGYNPPVTYYENKEKDYKLLYSDFTKKFLNISRVNYNILLMHTPIGILESNLVKYLKNVDLVLTGHTHGGLLPSWIPGHWGVISPFKGLLPKNVRGIIKRGNTVIIINSGVIKLSHTSGLFRYLNFLYSTHIIKIAVNRSKTK